MTIWDIQRLLVSTWISFFKKNNGRNVIQIVIMTIL